MSPEEFMAWRVFDTISPIGGEREVRQAALIASVIANVNRGPKQEAFTLDDFDLYKPRRPLTRAEEEERFRQAFESAGLVQR
jgi:hypothetical protein